MTTSKRDRITALIIAILFFAFASSFSVIVIIQLISTHRHNNNSANNTSQQATSLVGTQLSGFTPVSTVSTLQATDTKVGSGQVAKAGDTVTVNYTGAVASTGTIFQSTQDTKQPVSISLKGVIKGWQNGIPGMKVGGTRRLLIPADQAYGANPPQSSGIPANAALVFDVELVKIGS